MDHIFVQVAYEHFIPVQDVNAPLRITNLSAKKTPLPVLQLELLEDLDEPCESVLLSVCSGKPSWALTDGDTPSGCSGGKLTYKVLDGWWTDAGTFESLLLANQLVGKTGANKMAAPSSPTKTRRKEVTR